MAFVAKLVSADSLGNAAGFMLGHIGLAKGIEKGRFTMIDVTHDGNDGRTGLQESRIILGRRIFCGISSFRSFLNGDAKFFCQDFDGILVQILVDGGHDAIHHEGFNNFADFPAKEFCQFLDRYARRKFHFCRISGSFPVSHMFFLLIILVERTGHEGAAFFFAARTFPVFLCLLLGRFFSSLCRNDRSFFHGVILGIPVLTVLRLSVLAGSVLTILARTFREFFRILIAFRLFRTGASCRSSVPVSETVPRSCRSVSLAGRAVSLTISETVIPVSLRSVALTEIAAFSLRSCRAERAVCRAVFLSGRPFLTGCRSFFCFRGWFRFHFLSRPGFSFGCRFHFRFWGRLDFCLWSRFRFFRDGDGRVGRFPCPILLLSVRRAALLVKANRSHGRTLLFLCGKFLFQHFFGRVIHAGKTAGDVKIMFL